MREERKMDNICSVCGVILTKVDIEYNNQYQTSVIMCTECLNECLESESSWNDEYDEDRDLLGY
jgi:hypothetical protein